MMIIVAITRRTGVFQWIAIKAAKASRGRPIRVILLMSVVTAALSALLDNVTTVLLTVPISMLIADGLGISPIPMLIAQIMASNIGGTATLIGDPPNIMIGSAARLGFLDFIIHLTPIAVIAFGAFAGIMVLQFRHQLKAPPDAAQRLAGFDESRAITDRSLLRRSLGVIGLTLIGFLIHQPLRLEPATIALTGAALLLLVSRVDINELLHEIEWSTLLFFIGVFVMVGALVQTGIIEAAAGRLAQQADVNPGGAALGLLWVSALASGILGSIPLVAATNPMLVELAARLGGVSLGGVGPVALHAGPMPAFWWSLALGACLGANFTIIGAAANVVVAGMAERNGHAIGFLRYVKCAFPATLATIILSHLYLVVRYL
jgi:Na+/H+ antiporter NhaD/arsenite permease-like protein